MESQENNENVGEAKVEGTQEGEIEIEDSTIEAVASGSQDDSIDRNNVDDSDIIDLRPNSDSEDSDDDDDDVGNTPPALFKKRKLSNSKRHYRSNNNKSQENDTSASGSSSKDDTNEDIVVDDDAEATTNPIDPDPGPPNLVNSSDNTDDDEDEDEDLPRSSVRARRIVRAADLDQSTSDEDDEEDANTDDVNDVDITDQAKDVLAKSPDPRGHQLLRDLHQRQLGRGHLLQPPFNQRQVSSLDMVRRLHNVSKLSGHEGCVNSLGFNNSGTKIASGNNSSSL